MSKNIRFGYGYLSENAAATADSTASGYDPLDAVALERAIGWKSGGTSSQRLKFHMASAITPTFLGIAAGNYSAWGTVNLQHSSDGSAWTTIGLALSNFPSTDSSQDYFSEIAAAPSRAWWALQWTGPSAAPEVGVFYLGTKVELAANDDVPGTEIDVYGVDERDTAGGIKRRNQVHRRLRRDVLAFGQNSTFRDSVRDVIRGEGGPLRPFWYVPLDESTSNTSGRAYLVGYEAPTLEVKRRFSKYGFTVPLLEEV